MKLTYEIQKPRFNYNLDVPTEYSFYQRQHPEFNDTQIFNLIYEEYLSGEIYSTFATGDELPDFAVALTMSKEEFMQRIQKAMEKYRKKHIKKK